MVTCKIPFKGHFVVKPDLSYLKLFGARVCLKRTGKGCSTLDHHNFTGIFLGYSSTDQNIRYVDLTSSVIKSVGPVLNNDQLYIMGPGEYLEPGLFILDPWGFVMYNFQL